jgi:hypothetical protein
MTEFTFILADRDKRITFNFEVFAKDSLGLAARLVEAFDERDIPREGRRGLAWSGCEFAGLMYFGVLWVPHHRLMSKTMTLYHDDAIYPPAIVLRPEGIIYGKIDERT